MPLGLLYTHKCCFRSLKMELLGNSFQGRDIQKLCFQCLCPNGRNKDPHPRLSVYAATLANMNVEYVL